MPSVVSPSHKHLGIDVERVSAVAEHNLGLEVSCTDGTTRRYYRAGAAIAAGDALITDTAEGPNDVQPSAAADTPIVGVWPSAYPAIADNSYFWAVVKGLVSVKAAATVVAGAPAVPIATAGTLDDTAATAANALAAASGAGAVFMTTTASGFATVRLT
jgi:hypothetical protein